MTPATEEIYQGLGEVFAEVFPRNTAQPNSEMTSNDVPGWDSLGHVALIVAIEDRFAIEFSPEEYVGFDSVGELVDMIASKRE
jgi:acyl carrier protein